MSVSNSGFALRINGTCPVTGVDCGPTAGTYRACCPADSFCPSSYNIDCCPTSANCTGILLQNPQCANQSWNLYDNEGYFCCEQGPTGYAHPGNSDGCAEPGYAFDSGDVVLNIISTGAASSTSASSTSISSSTSSPTKTPSPSPQKSNTGAIAGGVISGVVIIILIAAAIWFFRSRKRSKRTAELATHREPAELQNTDGKDILKEPSELANQHGVSELGGGKKDTGRPSELWDPHTVSELDG